MTFVMRKTAAGFFLVFFAGLLIFFHQLKQRLMIVHSFERNLAWVKDFDQGVKSVLLKDRFAPMVHWHYLELDHIHHEREKELKLQELKSEIERFDPHVVIAVDDDSNAFLSGVFGQSDRPKILYAGIEESPSRYGYLEHNISGIKGGISIPGMEQLFFDLFLGKGVRFAVIGHNDLSGRLSLEQVSSHDWKNHQLVDSGLFSHRADLLGLMHRLNQKSLDVVIVLNYSGVEKDNFDEDVLDRDVVSLIELSSQALPIGTHADFVLDGGGLAIECARDELGRRIMEMALTHLKKGSSNLEVSQLTIPNFDIAADLKKLEKRGVILPSIYIEEARKSGQLRGNSS